MTSAADIHVFSQGDFRRHDQYHLNRSAFLQLQRSPHQCATGTQILSASSARATIGRNPQDNRNLIGKTLTASALDPVLVGVRHAGNTLTQDTSWGKEKSLRLQGSASGCKL